MTSNTVPFGIVSSSDSSSNAYTAYNTSQLDGWVSPGAGGDWIQYRLITTAIINKISFVIATNAGFQSIIFAGSNDNLHFTTLTTYTTSNVVNNATLNFNNNNSYLYYRFTVVNPVSITFDVIQMYGY